MILSLLSLTALFGNSAVVYYFWPIVATGVLATRASSDRLQILGIPDRSASRRPRIRQSDHSHQHISWIPRFLQSTATFVVAVGLARQSFRQTVKWRIGCEGRISHLKRSYGWDRTMVDTTEGARIWIGQGVSPTTSPRSPP